MSAIPVGQQEFCVLCGRLVERDALFWSSRRQGFVCLDCMNEEENCGCEDE